MDKLQLQEKYPEHKIKFEPLNGCPRCNGTGEFINGSKDNAPCFCVCIGFFRQYPQEFHEAANATARKGKQGYRVDNRKEL